VGAELPQLSERLALTINEAAATVGVSERHLRSVLPEIPHGRLGGRVVIPVDSFREWLQRQAENRAGQVDALVGEILEVVRSGEKE
jgi:hypothetical protein